MPVDNFQDAIAEIQRKRAEKLAAQSMRCSIVIASFQKAPLLARTLDSIIRQRPPFRHEVIVVDDGSTDNTQEVCESRPVTYRRIDREPTYRNPCFARNLGYKLASGEVIISQSDDVVHEGTNVIERLVSGLQEGESRQATVWNTEFSPTGVAMRRMHCYCGESRKEPLFFLGSIHRSVLYSIGSLEERLNEPGYDDTLLAEMLKRIGVKFEYLPDVVGLHQNHPRIGLRQIYKRMEAVFVECLDEMERTGKWVTSSGPWLYREGKSFFDD